MKGKLLLTIVLGATLLIGCTNSKTPEQMPVVPSEKPIVEQPAETPKVDAVTSPSLAKDVTILEESMGINGSWIVLVKNDITTDKELIIEGDFTKQDKEDKTKMVPAGRKLAIYDRNAEKVTTAKYTLTAPKLTVRSNDTTIQGGTFVGDIYVNANEFTIKDVRIEGNIYFASQEFMDSFDIEEGAVVTGVREVKPL